MKGLRRLLLILLCLGISPAVLAARPPQNSASAATDKDRAAIEKAVQNYMDVWNGHDVQAVVMTYTEDCDFVNAFGTLYHGRAKMLEIFGPMLSSSGAYSATHQTGTVRTLRFLKPDVAAVDVDWEMTGAKNPDGSVRPTRKGLHSLIMIKQSDGSWLIAIMHVLEFTNTPPLAPPAPPVKPQ